MTPRELRACAGQMRADALRLLEPLVMAESPSGDRVRLAEAADVLATMFANVGGQVAYDPGPDGDHLVVTWPGEESAGHLLLVGHHDTALPAGTTVDRPFRVSGDLLTGPGVYDMKGALVSVALAMRLIERSGRTLRAPVRLVCVNDEEIGSPDGSRVVKAHSVGAQVALGLEPALQGGALKIGRRGVARAELRVIGVEAHSGLDAALGVSAIDELVDQLAVLRARTSGVQGCSVNVGTVHGGTRANVVAGEAYAEIGVRFADADGEAAVLAAVYGLAPIRVGSAVDVRLLSHRPAWVPDERSALVAELVARASGMGLTLGRGVSGGAGDTNYLGSSGLPTVDGLGPDGHGAHSASEEASLASLLDRAALLADFLAPGERSDTTEGAQ